MGMCCERVCVCGVGEYVYVVEGVCVCGVREYVYVV